MSVIFVILPLAVVFAGFAVAAFVVAARRGQYDDLDSPPWRVLFDDSPPTRPDADADSDRQD